MVYAISANTECDLMIVNRESNNVENLTIQNCQCANNGWKALGDVWWTTVNGNKSWDVTFQCEGVVKMISGGNNTLLGKSIPYGSGAINNIFPNYGWVNATVILSPTWNNFPGQVVSYNV